MQINYVLATSGEWAPFPDPNTLFGMRLKERAHLTRQWKETIDQTKESKIFLQLLTDVEPKNQEVSCCLCQRKTPPPLDVAQTPSCHHKKPFRDRGLLGLGKEQDCLFPDPTVYCKKCF